MSLDTAFDHQAPAKQEKERHNEVVLSSAWWQAHVPDIIEGFFFTTASLAAQNERWARQVHGDFLRRYPARAAQTPLLRFSPEDEREPLSEVLSR